MSEPIVDAAAARRSLEGLALGDAFGELFFTRRAKTFEELSRGTWCWTDDTHMALSIVEVLERFGTIDQDALAQAFARRFAEEPWRGYGGGAVSLLRDLRDGGDWRVLAPALFSGGSYGNGGAMRAAPIGAWFTGEPDRAATEAARSAAVTHAHPEGQAGAIAVAVATALLPRLESAGAAELLEAIAAHVPAGLTKDGILAARAVPVGETFQAALLLGSGHDISAQDTVPFCLWIVAHHHADFTTALWEAVAVPGDYDTVAAIVGGVLGSLVEELPANWIARREPLPAIGAAARRSLLAGDGS
jgi:ADP-ribosylglycohydrolase